MLLHGADAELIELAMAAVADELVHEIRGEGLHLLRRLLQGQLARAVDRIVLIGFERVDRMAHQVDDARRVLAQRSESTRLNSSHGYISYAVFCLKKKKIKI